MNAEGFGFELAEQELPSIPFQEFREEHDFQLDFPQKPAFNCLMEACSPRAHFLSSFTSRDWMIDHLDLSRFESGEQPPEVTATTKQADEFQSTVPHNETTQCPVRRKKQNYQSKRVKGDISKRQRSQCLETKNILRNMGIAQNHFILFNPRAQKVIVESEVSMTDFHEWVRGMRPQNFVEFRLVWSTLNHPFNRLYRRLCLMFYCQDAIPYILLSRLRKSQKAHLIYLYRFIQGALHPEGFTRFK